MDAHEAAELIYAALQKRKIAREKPIREDTRIIILRGEFTRYYRNTIGADLVMLNR